MEPILLPTLTHYAWMIYEFLYRGIIYLWKNSRIPEIQISSMFATTLPPIYTITVFLFLLGIILTLFFYIKLRHPFWNIQPVYHTYDFWRYFYKTPFVIHKQILPSTKFCQPFSVKTINYVDVSEKQKEELTDMIQCYYKLSDNVFFTLSRIQIEKYMGGHRHPSYISFYMNTKYEISKTTHGPGSVSVDIDISNTSPIQSIVTRTEEPVACMISYPIYLITSLHHSEPLVSNHWDFISVKREYKKRNIQRYLIQTHEYKVRIRDPGIAISSFQKEYNSSEGVVPLVKYTNNLYIIKNIHLSPLPIPITINRIYEENKDILMDWLTDMKTRTARSSQLTFFHFHCIPDTSTLFTLIKSNIYFVYAMKEKEKILALYFMKDTHTYYDKMETDGNILQALSCIKLSTLLSPELFTIGFMHCIKDMHKNVHKKYTLLSVNDTAHNESIVKTCDTHFIKIESTQNAFYLYNYFYPNTPMLSSSYFSII
jgi:hypothetical protein